MNNEKFEWMLRNVWLREKKPSEIIPVLDDVKVTIEEKIVSKEVIDVSNLSSQK